MCVAYELAKWQCFTPSTKNGCISWLFIKLTIFCISAPLFGEEHFASRCFCIPRCFASHSSFKICRTTFCDQFSQLITRSNSGFLCLCSPISFSLSLLFYLSQFCMIWKCMNQTHTAAPVKRTTSLGLQATRRRLIFLSHLQHLSLQLSPRVLIYAVIVMAHECKLFQRSFLLHWFDRI